MGMFDWLLGTDPTDKWPLQNLTPLEYDLDHHRLCGIRLGATVQAFETLGRAEDRPAARKGRLVYYTRGFEVHTEQGHVMDAYLYFTDDWGPAGSGARPFAGKLAIAGREVRWTARTTEPEVINALGEPTERKQHDDGEVLLRYIRGSLMYEVSITDRGTLEAIEVTAEEKVG